MRKWHELQHLELDQPNDWSLLQSAGHFQGCVFYGEDVMTPETIEGCQAEIGRYKDPKIELCIMRALRVYEDDKTNPCKQYNG